MSFVFYLKTEEIRENEKKKNGWTSLRVKFSMPHLKSCLMEKVKLDHKGCFLAYMRFLLFIIDH